MALAHFVVFFFFNDTATTEIYTLSLHDALPILSFAEYRALTSFAKGLFLHKGGRVTRCTMSREAFEKLNSRSRMEFIRARSEEHTSELQSRQYLVCRLLLEKKKKCRSAYELEHR